MPILKEEKVHEFENVTIIVFKDIHLRAKKAKDTRLHVAVSEVHKNAKGEAVEMYNVHSHINSPLTALDVLLDFPNELSLIKFIQYLTEIKKEVYEK